MLRVRFQTMLIIMVTACVTIFAYESLRDRVKQVDFDSIASSWSSKPIVHSDGSVTIKLPVLATTSVNTVVSVPDGGVFMSGRVYGRRQSAPPK